jgi:hypothetical protein
MVMVSGPPLTNRSTEEPFSTWAPDAGLERMTRPSATVVLASVVTVPTSRPASLIACSAAACCWLASVGTATCSTVGSGFSPPLMATATATAPPSRSAASTATIAMMRRLRRRACSSSSSQPPSSP